MANYRRSEIVSGAFILAAVLVFALFAFKVGGFDLDFLLPDRKQVFQTLLPQIQTLEVGAKVTVGGRRVGRVTRLEVALPEHAAAFRSAWASLWGIPWGTYAAEYEEAERRPLEPKDDPPKVLVWFEVYEKDLTSDDHKFVLSGRRSRALLLQDGLLGVHHIQINPGPDWSPEGAMDVFGDDVRAAGFGSDERPIPLIGQEAGLFQILLPLANEATALLRKANEELLGPENVERFNRMMEDLALLASDTREMVTDLRPLFQPEHERSLDRRLIEPANTLLRNADSTLLDLKNDLRAKIIDRVSGLIDQGSETLTLAQTTLRSANDLLEEGGPKLQDILANLRTTTGNLEARLDDLRAQIDRVVEGATTTLDQARGMIAENRPDLAETLRALRRTAWEAEMAIRKVRANPAVLIWGDDERLLGTWPADETGLRRSGRAAPYQQRDENENK